MGFLPLLEKGVNGQLAKQTNSNWNNKGEQFSLISHQAISNLNLAYLLYINGYQDKKNKSHYNKYNWQDHSVIPQRHQLLQDQSIVLIL